MEEEHSTNPNDIVQMTSNSRRLQIRRGILRQTTTLRSSPYNSSSSNIRRRQNSLIASQALNNLVTDVDLSTNDREEIEMVIPETEFIENNYLVTRDEEDFDVLVDFSNTSSSNLTHTNEEFVPNSEQNESYHSLSTIDFDPDDEDEDDDDDHRFYYTSSTEPLIVHNNPIKRYDEYSSERNNLNDDEDLSIEIILETSQNNSLSPIPIPSIRRRRSIIPSNILNNRGLRLTDILSIPQKLYSSIKEQINDKYQQTTLINTQCYICLEDFQSIDTIKILNCQHIFHA
jgi:hypothetical protein